jgi:glutamate N-acetyltransferase/amino-acid N-acetyltransferase
MTTQDLTGVTAPLGFRAAGGRFGIKASGNPDLALIACDVPCRVAAVFTLNTVPSEPVLVNKKHVAGGLARAIVCNSGNANAATGKRGHADAIAMCRAVAKHLRCDPHQIIVNSTGIIGHPLPMEKILPGIDVLAGRLARGLEADTAAATAIMTTDLVPKAAVRRVKIGGKAVTLGGTAKGSGMIAPNMATMLAFLTTDAAISAPALRAALGLAVNAGSSFNRITVDQHTSCSDTVAILASGLAENKTITATSSADYKKFLAALIDLCRDLSYQIVKDGEGATKLLRISVTGARSDADALKIAKAIADSPLVKTAAHGADPNWGRIVTAAGYSGAAVDPKKLSLTLGDQLIFRRGEPVKFDLPKVQAVMKQYEVPVRLSVGLGRGATEVLTCDLSREYIAINADYHT